MALSLAPGMLIQYLAAALAYPPLPFIRSWSSPPCSFCTSTTYLHSRSFPRFVKPSSRMWMIRHRSYRHWTRCERYCGRRSIQHCWTGAFASSCHTFMHSGGFWLSTKLVREGRIGSGDAVAVFWTASRNLQIYIPRVIALAKANWLRSSSLVLSHLTPRTACHPSI